MLNCAQHTVQTTWADDADAEFLLHLTNFLTADRAAGGLLPSSLNRRPLLISLTITI